MGLIFANHSLTLYDFSNAGSMPTVTAAPSWHFFGIETAHNFTASVAVDHILKDTMHDGNAFGPNMKLAVSHFEPFWATWSERFFFGAGYFFFVLPYSSQALGLYKALFMCASHDHN